jgi:glycosyltransferase involved in cell wall biosynthesis
MPPRRVTVMVDSLIPGGAERVAVDAAGALDPGRYQPHLLVGRESGALAERAEELGVPFTILGRKRGFAPRLFARARAIVADSDLLHAHKFAGSTWGVLLARAARRPLVAHEHTFDGAKSVTRTVFYRYVIGRSAARIICVTSRVADSLQREGVPERKLEVIPNGVPVSGLFARATARTELGLAADARVVGMVARLRPEKRHMLALEAMAEAVRSDERLVLCVVGDGPLSDALHVRARELDLEDHVVWAGQHANARRLMPAFDALLFTSSFEGMPLAAVEAIVAGVPVVSTDVGQMRELLDDGLGTIVSGDDPESIAAAVRTTTSGLPVTPARLADLRHRFSLERLALDIQRVYDLVLDGEQ